jgi:hypothetical protein
VGLPARPLFADRDAEERARDWMIWLGFVDAHLTVSTGDGGIDVVASHAVAEVKFREHPSGEPYLRNLVGGAADYPGRARLFFSKRGYSKRAVAYAGRHEVALFTLRPEDGAIVPENDYAAHLCGARPRGNVPPPAYGAPSSPRPSRRQRKAHTEVARLEASRADIRAQIQREAARRPTRRRRQRLAELEAQRRRLDREHRAAASQLSAVRERDVRRSR